MRSVLPSAGSCKDPARDALFTRIYKDHRPYVRAILSRRGVPPRDVEDVVQDVFGTAYRRLCDLDPTRTARPWLHVIAVYTASNYRARARHRREKLSVEVAEPVAEVESAESRLIAHQGFLWMRARVSRLRPKLRAVVAPYVLEGRTIAEIRASLQIPEKTAFARLRLARKALVGHR